MAKIHSSDFLKRPLYTAQPLHIAIIKNHRLSGQKKRYQMLRSSSSWLLMLLALLTLLLSADHSITTQAITSAAAGDAITAGKCDSAGELFSPRANKLITILRSLDFT